MAFSPPRQAAVISPTFPRNLWSRAEATGRKPSWISLRQSADDFVSSRKLHPARPIQSRYAARIALERFQEFYQRPLVVIAQSRLFLKIAGAEVMPAVDHIIRTL